MPSVSCVQVFLTLDRSQVHQTRPFVNGISPPVNVSSRWTSSGRSPTPKSPCLATSCRFLGHLGQRARLLYLHHPPRMGVGTCIKISLAAFNFGDTGSSVGVATVRSGCGTVSILFSGGLVAKPTVCSAHRSGPSDSARTYRTYNVLTVRRDPHYHR